MNYLAIFYRQTMVVNRTELTIITLPLKQKAALNIYLRRYPINIENYTLNYIFMMMINVYKRCEFY